jgi:WD40 repeat protein
VRFSSDGTMLVSCSGEGYGRDNSVRLWDVGTGKELKKLEGHRRLHFALPTPSPPQNR